MAREQAEPGAGEVTTRDPAGPVQETPLDADERHGYLGSIEAETAGEPPAAEPDSLTEPAPTAVEEPLPPAETPRVEPEPEEHHVEEAGPSFASRVLTGLVLLLAGAAVALWGAPKLAPLLPSGLAPVSAWLTPGETQAEARVTALEARVDNSLREVTAQVADLASGAAVDAKIGSAVTQSEARTNSAIAALHDQIGQGGDTTDIRQRLDRLEGSVNGEVAQLETLKQQISSGAAASSDATAAQIDLYRAELDGLRAEMGTLSDKVGALAARIEAVSADASRQITTAQTKVTEVESKASTAVDAATAQSDIAQLKAAMAAGLPFADPLARLSARPGVTLPEGLSAAADKGIPTLAQLRDSFPDAAHAAIRASILAGAGNGLIARSRAYLEAQVASRSLTPQPGRGPDAVLSRMEDALRHDNLAGALAEAGSLPSEATAAMADWLDAARLRVNAEADLAALNAAPPATN